MTDHARVMLLERFAILYDVVNPPRADQTET